MMRNILLGVLIVAVPNTPVEGFSTCSLVPSTTPCNRQPSSHIRDNPVSCSRTCLFASTYGRGAEIWPPGNDAPIRLEASFPNGILPDLVVDRMTGLTTAAGLRTAEEATAAVAESSTKTHNKPLRRTYVPRAIGRILRRAAYAQEETESEATASPMDRTPMVLAAGLVLSRMIRPLDALIVSFLTGYFIILFLAARSVRRDGITPVMPSLPPQGHVPNLVTNPLGPCFTTYSMNYDYWLKTGALLGLAVPVAMMLRYAATDRWDCARACARPIFILCCQAVSEAVSRRSLTPLPIRVLIPVAYNTVRLGYLWSWAFQSLMLGSLGRAIAIANLVYWLLNLFGFLIPIATVKYMRAHFFAVEAEQVTTRSSMEDSAGLML